MQATGRAQAPARVHRPLQNLYAFAPSVRIMRCFRTYGAISRTSSIVTVCRPFSLALAWKRSSSGSSRELTELDAGHVAGAPAERDDVAADHVGHLGRLELLSGLVEAHDSEERPHLAEHVRCDAVVGRFSIANSYSGSAYSRLILNERSSWDSGSKTPGVSYGFWVAITRNGSGSLCTAVDRDLALIGSKRAAWVRGGVRLISSARGRS